MKFDQGFATWSTKSLTQGDANGQGTVASSTSDQRFNRNLLAVESLFVRENSDEPVPFVMYARGFERFVSLGISPGKNYPGITTQNLLVHIVVPQTAKPWEAFAGCLVAPPFSSNLDDQDYMRTDLPVLEAGEEDASFFDIADILSEFGFNEDINRLAHFLQGSVGAILSQSGTLLIVLPDGNTQELRRQAARITWLIAMAMPKPADNTIRYIRNISYGVGTKDNAGKATVIFAGSSAADEVRSNQVIRLDSYLAEKEEEEILPVFRALSNKIEEFSRKNVNRYQLIRELEEGRDPVWGDLQQIGDARYSNSSNLTVPTLNMSYIYWRLEDPENRGHVSYDDIKDYYSGLLVQTKLGKKWHETLLFNYLKQENTPDYQSELALWKEVLSPALKRRNHFDKETWNEYLEMIFWCVKHGHKKSSKNHKVFMRQLKNNDEDSEKIQLALYDRSDIIDKEIEKIKSAEDYWSFVDMYELLCQKHPEVKQRAFVPVSFKVYINPATSLEEREEISRKNLPDFSKKVEKYIGDFFTAERIGLFFKDELKRTEDQYLSYSYECLYGYLEHSHSFWDDFEYQKLFSDEMRKRSIRCKDPGFSAMLNREYRQELDSCTIDDLFQYPDINQIDHLDNNKVNWYSPWQERVFYALKKESLTSSQFRKVCDACIDNELFSYLGDQETYKSLFRILWRAADHCVIDQSFSGEKKEIDALRMIVQITWMEVCESNEWELEITENDYDVWDWKGVDDFSNCYDAWVCLSEIDRYKILSFPEPQNLRGRISNQNFLIASATIYNNGDVRETLERERLEDRYYYSRNEAGNPRRLYLYNMACTSMLTVITDKYRHVEESEIAINRSALRNILLNLAWVLSLFDTDVYWADNDEYRKLTPNQRRMHFYESFYYEFRQPFDTFIRLYNEYYQYPNRGEEYIKQGWRYNKLHEDYNEYQRNSEQIKDAISIGVYDKNWRGIICNLDRNLSEGEGDKMVSADIYDNTQNALEEIQCSFDSLKESLENDCSRLCVDKEKNNADIARASDLLKKLNQLMGDLKEEKKKLEADGVKLKQKAENGNKYVKGTRLKFSAKIETDPAPVNRNAAGEANMHVRDREISNKNSVTAEESARLANLPPKQRQKESFREEAKRKGKVM